MTCSSCKINCRIWLDLGITISLFLRVQLSTALENRTRIRIPFLQHGQTTSNGNFQGDGIPAVTFRRLCSYHTARKHAIADERTPTPITNHTGFSIFFATVNTNRTISETTSTGSGEEHRMVQFTLRFSTYTDPLIVQRSANVWTRPTPLRPRSTGDISRAGFEVQIGFLSNCTNTLIRKPTRCLPCQATHTASLTHHVDNRLDLCWYKPNTNAQIKQRSTLRNGHTPPCAK